MRNKVERIHNNEIIKNRRKNHFVKTKGYDTPTVCSCWMCGNPRKFRNEKTLNEKSFEELNKYVYND